MPDDRNVRNLVGLDRVAAGIPPPRRRTRPGRWTGCCRWTPQWRRHASTPQTRLASQRAESNYRQPRIEPCDHGIDSSHGGLSTEIHQLVDGKGLPLVSLTTPGQGGDSPTFLSLMGQLRVGPETGRPRPVPTRRAAMGPTRLVRCSPTCVRAGSRS